MKRKILIIDDEQNICDLVDEWLFKKNFKVLKADNSDSGLKIIKEENPDLVLVDALLPGISGIELCQKIRDDESLDHIHLIMISGVYSEQSLIGQTKMVTDGFLAKPFKEEDLISKLNKFFPDLSGESEKKEIPKKEKENSIDKGEKGKPDDIQEIKFEYTDPGEISGSDSSLQIDIENKEKKESKPLEKDQPPMKSESQKVEKKETEPSEKKFKDKKDKYFEQELENLFKMVKSKKK